MADDTSGGDPHDLTDLDGVGSGKAESLREAGFESVADVQEATTEELTEVDGIGDALAAEINESAAELGDEGDAEEAAVQADGGEAAAKPEEEDADESDADEDETGTDEDAADADDSDADDSDVDDSDNADEDADEDDADANVNDDLDMLDVRDAVRDVAETLIEDPFDGIIEIERDEEGWYAVVEVIERSAVPDTQDILGRYAIDLDESGSVLGYRLTDRYRRGDTSDME